MELNEFAHAMQARRLKELAADISKLKPDRLQALQTMLLENGEDLMTVPEVAERLRVCRETVRRWARSGRLKAFRAGRKYLISDAALQAFLERENRDDNQAAAVK